MCNLLCECVVCSLLFVVRGLLVVCCLLFSGDVWRMRFVVWCCVLFVMCSCLIIDFFVGHCCVLLGVSCCLLVDVCGCAVLRTFLYI